MKSSRSRWLIKILIFLIYLRTSSSF